MLRSSFCILDLYGLILLNILLAALSNQMSGVYKKDIYEKSYAILTYLLDFQEERTEGENEKIKNRMVAEKEVIFVLETIIFIEDKKELNF